MQVKDLRDYGWKVDGKGEVMIVWDTEESIAAVQALVDSLTSGCGCKTGCTGNRCKCFKASKLCSVGGHCQNCANNGQEKQLSAHDSTAENSDSDSSSASTQGSDDSCAESSSDEICPE